MNRAPIVRAVRHTVDLEAWSQLLAALGTDGLELRRCDPGSGRRGRTDFGLVVDDVEQVRVVLSDPVARQIDWHIEPTAEFTAFETPPLVSVLPLWMTPVVDEAAKIITRLGLRPRLRSDSGEWADFSGTRGLAAVHQGGSPEVVLAFESADLDLVATRLRTPGLRADIVDENYGRSLRIDDPDGGEEIMVNETIRDLYGYRRMWPER